MSSKRTYTDYLRDILDAVEKAEEFAHGIDLDRFAADSRTHFAVVRALEIIGEAVKNVLKTAGFHGLYVEGVAYARVHQAWRQAENIYNLSNT